MTAQTSAERLLLQSMLLFEQHREAIVQSIRDGALACVPNPVVVLADVSDPIGAMLARGFGYSTGPDAVRTITIALERACILELFSETHPDIAAKLTAWNLTHTPVLVIAFGGISLAALDVAVQGGAT
jgi:hypothetical protein